MLISKVQYGTTTLNIMTLSIMTFSITVLNIMTFSITALSILVFSITLDKMIDIIDKHSVI